MLASASVAGRTALRLRSLKRSVVSAASAASAASASASACPRALSTSTSTKGDYTIVDHTYDAVVVGYWHDYVALDDHLSLHRLTDAF